MKNLILGIAIFLIGFIGSGTPLHAKKIKNSFTVEKEGKTKKNQVVKIDGIEINLADSLALENSEWREFMPELLKINFAGYDKEPNSSQESFILINPSSQAIVGYEVRIDYLDMQGRMLHSRTIKDACFVPPGETRKFDIKSWDTQHTYYYYLGNEPRKVATPFQVAFHPITLWINP